MPADNSWPLRDHTFFRPACRANASIRKYFSASRTVIMSIPKRLAIWNIWRRMPSWPMRTDTRWPISACRCFIVRTRWRASCSPIWRCSSTSICWSCCLRLSLRRLWANVLSDRCKHWDTNCGIYSWATATKKFRTAASIPTKSGCWSTNTTAWSINSQPAHNSWRSRNANRLGAIWRGKLHTKSKTRSRP